MHSHNLQLGTRLKGIAAGARTESKRQMLLRKVQLLLMTEQQCLGCKATRTESCVELGVQSIIAFAWTPLLYPQGFASAAEQHLYVHCIDTQKQCRQSAMLDMICSTTLFTQLPSDLHLHVRSKM